MAFCSACRPRQISWRWPLTQAAGLGAMAHAGRHAVVAGGQYAAVLHDDGPYGAAHARGARGDLVRQRHEVLVPAGAMVEWFHCLPLSTCATGWAAAQRPVARTVLASLRNSLGGRPSRLSKPPSRKHRPRSQANSHSAGDLQKGRSYLRLFCYLVPKILSPASPRPGTM